MKITLRKVKSVAIGEDSYDSFFIPIALEPNQSAISITNNWHGFRGQYFTILRKYDLDYQAITRVCDKADIEKRVITYSGKIDVIVVPKTFASSRNITKYSNQICNSLYKTRYIHFTHFGYLRTDFPTNQIKQILEVFVNKTKINCEVCWDIDEKFFEDMESLLSTTLLENNLINEFETYTDENFEWNSEYKATCDEQIRIFNATTRSNNLIRNQITNENIVRNEEVVTRSIDELPNIGSVAAGNAGEYYALSLFIRMGFVAGKAPEGTATYDLLVMSNDGFAFNPVQVKTITNGQHWLLRQHHEEVVNKLIFCFVKLTDISIIPKVYLIPADVVSYVIKMCHEIYLALPNRSGGAHADGHMRTLKIDFSTLIANIANPEQYLNNQQLSFISNHSLGWLDAYENNFDIFKTQD